MVAAARNQPDKAIAELALIGDEDPLAPVARIAAGQTEIRRGRTRPAEAAFLAAIRLLPAAVQARRELVYIYNIQHRQLEMDAQLTALAGLLDPEFSVSPALEQDEKRRLEPEGGPSGVQEVRPGRSRRSLVPARPGGGTATPWPA